MSQLSTTVVLLNGFRAGETGAVNDLFNLYQPLLLKWAHGRIPEKAKGYLDTQDVVQDTMALAFKNKEKIQAESAGAFFCYLRTIFINQIKQELRKNRPFQLALTTQFSNHEKLAYEEDLHALMAYDEAIDKLNEAEKQAVVMRIEFGLSHQEIADLMQKNSADAARMSIARAMAKLGRLMACQNQQES
ncbi:RNA polymerase sigma factor [Marinicella sp. W31]|uniref:RNA polymerase sigma factor n=1 Tax=Marinicella sp. W31 TaxID=3023713 RepID=UPI0037567085